MTVPEIKSREELGWDQSPGSKPGVCLPGVDLREPMIRHAPATDSLPPSYGQPVPLFPSYAMPSGTNLMREAYIAKSEVKKHDVAARGTKGSKWRRDNALQNELMKDKREKWWRSQRLERAAKRGIPWGAEVNLHEVKVRIPERGGTSNKENEDAVASVPGKDRAPRTSEFESFMEWFREDKAAKRRTMRAPLRRIPGNIPDSKITPPGDSSEALAERLPSTDPPDAEFSGSHVDERLHKVTSPSTLLPSSPPSTLPPLLPLPPDTTYFYSLQQGLNGLTARTRGSQFEFPPGSMASGRHSPRTAPKNGTKSFFSSQEHLRAIWRQRPFLDLKVGPILDETSTLDLWTGLSSKGHIKSIEIWRTTRRYATVRFLPPPQEDFFTADSSFIFLPSNHLGQFKAYVEVKKDQRTDFEVPSPVRKGASYPEIIELHAESIDFGAHVDQKSMTILRSLHGTYSQPVKLVVDTRRRQIAIHFFASIGSDLRHFRFFVAVEDLNQIVQTTTTNKISFILRLPGPPPYYKFLQKEIPKTHVKSSLRWKDEDAWFRQTSIEKSLANIESLKSAPANLKKVQANIDIGRWTSYRLTFDGRTMDQNAFQYAVDAFKDFNVVITSAEDFRFVDSPSTVFDFIDATSKVAPASKNHQTSLEAALALSTQAEFPLSFPVRYQLEVCLSNNMLCEFSLGREFLTKLGKLPEDRALQLLEHVASLKQRFYNPMDIFDLLIARLPKIRIKVPEHCNVMRTAVVTATTVVYNSPTVEMTNRVIRQYHSDVDRFLRVRFEDDKFRGNGKIYASTANYTVELFTRIKRVLTNGIILGDRHYEFVAFGNSQLREHAAYFFASTSYLSAGNIRAWLGSFEKEKIVAKHAARMGQCFSTTRAILGTRMQRPTEATLVADIRRGDHIFSDGVGKMSPFLARLIAMELGLDIQGRNVPSCYQFRLGGCKGVLATSTDLQKLQIEIRQSQFKFDTQHHGLEIIRWAQYWSASLNRQLIVVLSFLGVEDRVFLSHQEHLVQLLEKAMCNDEAAVEGLQASVDPNRMTLTLASMVSDGFREANDPFVTSCLRLWRAWSIKYLKEKAKIPVRNGACILGVVDETATLQGHFNDRMPNKNTPQQQNENALPEIFIQITRPDTGELEVITGKCILARNPSLHPGDIRVVRAVHVKALEHHRDVVVLPQTGDRDLSSMCSGGDLDGDDYVVIWDQDFLPKDWFYEPMDYTPPEPQKVATEVTTNDITSFFVNYMRQDFLGQIANTHLALADDPEYGLGHPDCLRLVGLHSQAVDFPKTGVPAEFPRELLPRKYPHFMEKKGRPAQQIRKSRQILGQLYDAVERVKFAPDYRGPFDERILSAYQPDDTMLEAAQEIKVEYDEAMQRIMAQHEIHSEFEVWTTFVLDHSQASGDFKFHEQIGRLSADLKDRFRNACVDQAGGEHSHDLPPFATAMYKVTQLQLQTAISEVEAGERDENNMPFISFPWLLHHTLSDIVKGFHHWTKTSTKPRTMPKPPTSAVPPIDSHFEITQGLMLSEKDKRSLLADGTRPISSVNSHEKENVKGSEPTPQAESPDVIDNEMTQGLSLSEVNKKRLHAEIGVPVSNADPEHMVRDSAGSHVKGTGAVSSKETLEDLITFGDDVGDEQETGKIGNRQSHHTTKYSPKPQSDLFLLQKEFEHYSPGPQSPSAGLDMVDLNKQPFFTNAEAKKSKTEPFPQSGNTGADWLTGDENFEANAVSHQSNDGEPDEEVFEDPLAAKPSALDALTAMNARMR